MTVYAAPYWSVWQDTQHRSLQRSPNEPPPNDPEAAEIHGNGFPH